MGGKQGPISPDYRAAFLAALEYGISPIARADYSKPPVPEPKPAMVIPRHHPRKHTPPVERRVVKTAADILAEVNS